MLIGALLSLAILAAAMGTASLVAERTRRSGFIDGIWALATGVAALAMVLAASGGPMRRLAVGGLVAVWAARLGRHLVVRTLGSAADDPRYADLRRQWGDSAPRRLFVFLQTQAAAGWLLALSAAAATSRDGPLGWQDGAGAVLAILALLGEWRADRTLTAFRRQRPGAICDVRLWGWSRHPNYFFEWLFWVGIAIVGVGGPDGRSALVLVAPAVMYWLLVHVSGIPPLERHMLRSRGAAFAAYQARVPAFFPRPRRGGQPTGQRDSAR